MTLEDLKSTAHVVGMKETERAIENRKQPVYLLLLTVMKELPALYWKPASRQGFLWNRDSRRKKSAVPAASK